jgi:c-di-GMP-binding flagellar brake protein YcgR
MTLAGEQHPGAVEQRKTARYELNEDTALTVVVISRDRDEPLFGELLDLSRGGAKIQLASTVAINSKIYVELKSTQTSEAIVRTDARVCWIRPACNQWWVGVAFENELPESEFTALAQNGFIERRRDTRIRHNASLTARWELGSDPIPVRLIDISAGGLKIASPEHGEVGHRVLFETMENDPSPIVAKIQWQNETAEGFLIGCAFANKHCFPILRKKLGIVSRLRLPIAKARLSTRRAIGLVLGVATIALGLWLITRFELVLHR